MKKLIAALAFLMTATVALAKDPAVQPSIKIHDQDHNGVPMFITGDLGKFGLGAQDVSAKNVLKAYKDLLKQTGLEDFRLSGTQVDSLGQLHVKLQQTYRGLPVVGAEYIIHVDRNLNVVAMNGRLAIGDDVKLPKNPTIDPYGAISKATSQLEGASNASIVDKPTLSYVINEKSQAFLAWTAKVSYKDSEGPQLTQVYADAGSGTGDLVLADNLYRRLKNRKVYSANNGTALPGTLLWSEGGTQTSDTTAQAAFNYAGNVYDYYKNVFNRDSYDNAGAAIISSVHYRTSYNNAFWNGSQMVYGDGDGTQFGPLSKALDVDAHELTHAVTERTANLVYSNESGALNEATSDILGNSCEAYSKSGGVPNANTWLVGEDITTPGTAGDALRYMNDPARAGDIDYYPTRYTGTADHGGVHTNSGIANLAYYMMVMGGTHPRAKTTINVTPLSATPATSLDMAQRIWYRALTTYWTSSTGFSGARTGTVQAATDLYGAAAAASVTAAWDAVGAPGGSGGGGGTTTLSNGVAVTGLSGSTGAMAMYKIAVPAGQTQLQIVMSGGTGDADMYVKRAAAPTLTVWDYRPYLTGNAETVTVANPVAGDWYIGVNAYATYSGVTLKTTYTGSIACTNYSATLSGTGATSYQPSTSGFASAAGSITGNMTGPGGTVDFDLYLEKLSGTTWTSVASGTGATTTENVSYTAAAGTYRWRVYAYSGSGTFNLCSKHP
jgi:Zn-dependent metalloprotease